MNKSKYDSNLVRNGKKSQPRKLDLMEKKEIAEDIYQQSSINLNESFKFLMSKPFNTLNQTDEVQPVSFRDT